MGSIKHILKVAVAGFAALGLAGYFLSEPIFCNGLVNPYAKTAAFIVTVPEDEAVNFDQRITNFLKSKGLGVSKGSQRTAEPLGERTPYLGHQVIGCDGSSLVWSGNDVKPREYIVTFHRNRLFDDQTAALRDSFLSEFSTRYSVRSYVDWRS